MTLLFLITIHESKDSEIIRIFSFGFTVRLHKCLILNCGVANISTNFEVIPSNWGSRFPLTAS